MHVGAKPYAYIQYRVQSTQNALHLHARGMRTNNVRPTLCIYMIHTARDRHRANAIPSGAENI